MEEIEKPIKQKPLINQIDHGKVKELIKTNSLTSIAKQFGVSNDTIRNILKKDPNYEELKKTFFKRESKLEPYKEKIIELLKDKKPQIEIAKQFNVTSQTLYQFIRRNNLKQNKE